MKYPTPEYMFTALDNLSAFMLLLKARTVKAALEPLGDQAEGQTEKFISMIETFIFITINIADADTMDRGIMKVEDPQDYTKRRQDFLKALGLDEYARTTYLLNPQALRPGRN
jgi:hypothetical protein